MCQGRHWNVVAAIGCALCLTACEDPKARIALLEEEKQSLGMDLERLRAELDRANRELGLCKDGLAAAQQNNTQLRGQVSTAPALPADWQSPCSHWCWEKKPSERVTFTSWQRLARSSVGRSSLLASSCLHCWRFVDGYLRRHSKVAGHCRWGHG